MMTHDATLDVDKTKLNTSEVSRLTGRGRSTIKRHADKGRVSFELDENGNRLFDRSEVERVYAEDIKRAAIGRLNTKATSEPNSASLTVAQDKLITEYQNRIDHLEKTLDKALNIAGLLEASTAKEATWQASLDATVLQVTEQTERQIQSLKTEHAREQETRDKEMLLLKRALKAERQKSIWQKLFG